MNIFETQVAYHSLDINNNNINLDVEFVQQIIDALLNVNIIRPQRAPQEALSNAIVRQFNEIIQGFSSIRAEKLCRLDLNYQYDGIIAIGPNRIGVEIQFRPDFLKDITRFQIGFNSGRVQAMIYIVGIDRDTIQEGTSMHEFTTINEHIILFDWLTIPIIVIGINCLD